MEPQLFHYSKRPKGSPDTTGFTRVEFNFISASGNKDLPGLFYARRSSEEVETPRD
jgi:hypothetical protein